MTAPAVSETSLTTGAVANSDPETEGVAPLHCDSAERGQQNAEQEDAEQEIAEQENAEELAVSDAKWGVFQELRPQFEGLLPPSVVLDCVDHAVQDLLGSINVEALPEMAIRLAAVRLERRLSPIGQPPGDGPPASAADRSTGAPKTAMTPPAPPFTVIRPPTPGYPLLALTVTTTQATSRNDRR
jgi:hypothetical protein